VERETGLGRGDVRELSTPPLVDVPVFVDVSQHALDVKNAATLQAKAILASVRPHDVIGKTRHRIPADQPGQLVAIEKRIKSLSKELKVMVQDSGSTLMELPRVGPIVEGRSWKVNGSSEGRRRGDQLSAPMAGGTGWLLCPGPRTAGRGRY
jgi:hypothetical protein